MCKAFAPRRISFAAALLSNRFLTTVPVFLVAILADRKLELGVVMRQPLVAGNWKMHGTRAAATDLVGAIKQGMGEGIKAEVVICPPHVYLADVARLVSATSIALGAQNLCAEAGEGAYTGEVSGAMLKDVGCRYVIVGHSERRALCGESDAVVAEKAYEPVRAIGTGRTATPAQAQDVHAFIRARIAAQDPALAGRMRIVYGGSVKANNAAELFAMDDIDGGLIGGASLDGGQFLTICHAAS